MNQLKYHLQTLDWRGILAYSDHELITDVKSLIALVPGASAGIAVAEIASSPSWPSPTSCKASDSAAADVIKLFTAASYDFS